MKVKNPSEKNDGRKTEMSSFYIFSQKVVKIASNTRQSLHEMGYLHIGGCPTNSSWVINAAILHTSR